MRRLCRSVTGMALLATLALGCGSTSGDSLVLRFQGFTGIGITQEDSVSPTSADVDVVQDACDPLMPEVFNEPITATQVNAVFRNEEAANIHLLGYQVHFNDPNSGVADVTVSLAGNPEIVGGRCSGSGAQCASSVECISSEGTEEICNHTNTVVGIVLVDFAAKSHVNPQIYGQSTSLTVTFFAEDDANRSLNVNAGYSVIFGDYQNCGATGTGGS